MGPGESAALAAAACWATASLLYGRTRMSAAGMNFCKNVLASVLLIVHLAFLSVIFSRPMFSADAHAWWWLGLSGVIGIVLGDTFYFRSLQILGPRRALIVSTTAPMFAVLFGWTLLGETLGLVALSGMLLTLAGIVWVISERQIKDEAPGLFPGTVRAGIVQGMLAAICLALGGVAAKVGMENCDPVEASYIRLSVSAAGALVVVTATGRFRDTIRQVTKPEVARRFVPAAILGTWLGIWFSQVAYKESKVAIATTLLSTSPLFVIPMVRVFFGVRISTRAILGTLVAIVGIALLAS